MPSRILVTGVAGFIGSHVAEALLRRGDTVIGVDSFHDFYPRPVKEAHLEEVRRTGGERFFFQEADITDLAALRALCAAHAPDSVIHLAARAGVRPSIEQPEAYLLTNVLGTQHILHVAAEHSFHRAVLASSSSVYGNYPTVPFHEDLDVNQPISPYAASKRAGEIFAYTHFHLTKMPTACLRFFTVFGPRQRPDLAIHSFLRRVSQGQTIQMFGDGSTSRDYTFVDDIVRGVLAAYDRIPEHGYRIWNLGGNSPHTLRELIQTVERVVGKAAVIEQKPMQAGDVERTYADISRAQAELGFAPVTSLEDGISKQWEWMKSHNIVP